MLYSIQDGGTDWRTLRLVEVASGKLLPEELKWVKTSAGEWLKDGSGFFYSRFPAPAAGAAFQSTNENGALYFPQARPAAGRRPAGLCRRQSSTMRRG